jgi:hypothetical protein
MLQHKDKIRRIYKTVFKEGCYNINMLIDIKDRITCFIIEPPTIIEPPYPPSIAIIAGYYCNTTTLRNNMLQLIILFRSVAFV